MQELREYPTLVVFLRNLQDAEFHPERLGRGTDGEHLTFIYRAETETRVGPQIEESYVNLKLYCVYNYL